MSPCTTPCLLLDYLLLLVQFVSLALIILFFLSLQGSSIITFPPLWPHFHVQLFPCATPWLLVDHLLLLVQFASLVLIILFSCTWIMKRLSPLSLSCRCFVFFFGKAMEISLHNFLLLLLCHGNWGSFSASLPFPALSKRPSNGSLSLLIIFVLFSFILIEECLELLSSFITLSLDKAMSKSSLDNFSLLLHVNWRMFSASLPIQYFLFAKQWNSLFLMFFSFTLFEEGLVLLSLSNVLWLQCLQHNWIISW